MLPRERRRFYSDFQTAIDYCAEDDHKVCVWYENVEGAFAKGASSQLDAYIKKVDAANANKARRGGAKL